jgi:hypothetical protein
MKGKGIGIVASFCVLAWMTHGVVGETQNYAKQYAEAAVESQWDRIVTFPHPRDAAFQLDETEDLEHSIEFVAWLAWCIGIVTGVLVSSHKPTLPTTEHDKRLPL